jgi:signal transduction histidine kinase
VTTILQNLIDNSLKYSLSDSEIKINVHAYDDDHLVLSISNLTPTKLMIDPVKIFDKYFRGTGSGGKPGLGIGLWLVNKIGTKIGISIDAIVDAEEIIFRLIIPNNLKNIK